MGQKKDGTESEWYLIGFGLTAMPTFIATWIYAMINYGWFLGLGLGWLPSIFIALIVGALWPILFFVCAGAFVLWVLGH